MKTVPKDKLKESPVRVDPKLDKYDDVVLFPNKLAKANEQVRNSNLAEFIKQKR